MQPVRLPAQTLPEKPFQKKTRAHILYTGFVLCIQFDFLLPVMAGVAGCYICKWLDRNHKDS
ncbi:hypothetical protein DWV29_20310 [Enterocloster asparagiformis]|uniref:Uncharacterized protein n=1 Tax=Enterocloster asparagiformis TaxID=333367 RepID=A0A413FAX7_9FIRM|nr:hypothetical protein DWV29_20310 [Enterocloster asparagiformis]